MGHGPKAFPDIHVWMYMCASIFPSASRNQSLFHSVRKSPDGYSWGSIISYPGQMNSSVFHNSIHKENSDKSVLGFSHAVLLWCANAIFLLKVLLQNFCSFSRIFSTFAVEFLFLLLLYEVSINWQTCFLFFITALLPLTVLCLFLACSGISAPNLGLW